MKAKLKRYFLLGLGAAAAGVAYANKRKIKTLVDETVKKGAITVNEGKKLTEELIAEVLKAEKKMVAKTKKVVKKVVKRKAAPKKKVVKKVVK
ncbi:hypothetical protein HOD20_09025, partial [archaeon]|nr:hypothetical protein [archaeon]